MVGKRELDCGTCSHCLPIEFVEMVRTVSLTEKGKQVFQPLFRRHAALIKGVFQDVSPEEIEQLETVLKKFGRRAESLAEKRVHF